MMDPALILVQVPLATCGVANVLRMGGRSEELDFLAKHKGRQTVAICFSWFQGGKMMQHVALNIQIHFLNVDS